MTLSSGHMTMELLIVGVPTILVGTYALHPGHPSNEDTSKGLDGGGV